MLRSSDKLEIVASAESEGEEPGEPSMSIVEHHPSMGQSSTVAAATSEQMQAARAGAGAGHRDSFPPRPDPSATCSLPPMCNYCGRESTSPYCFVYLITADGREQHVKVPMMYRTLDCLVRDLMLVKPAEWYHRLHVVRRAVLRAQVALAEQLASYDHASLKLSILFLRSGGARRYGRHT